MKDCKECYGKGYVFEYNDIRIPCDCVEEIETIKDLKRELNLSNTDLAKCFNMSYGAYANSTAKERYENALLNFYKLAKKGWEKNKTKNLTSDNQTIKHELKPLTIHGVTQRSELVCKHDFQIDTTTCDPNHIYICTKCGEVQTCG